MLEEISSWPFWLSCAVVAVAGMVRGFAGFGSAMVMMPVLAAIHGPAAAVAIALTLEIITSLQLVPRAARLVDWRQIGVLTASACLLTPLGAWILLTLDPAVMRWALSAVVLSAVAILAFGWRYAGKMSLVATSATGAVSGLLNGASSMDGPPVVFYYLAGASAAERIRASLIVYFSIVDIFAILVLTVGGAVTLEMLRQAAMLAVPLVAGIWLGARLFGLASEDFYRRVALVVLVAIAIGGLLL